MLGRALHSLHVYYAGGIILLALLLGGGTAQGLWTDHVLQIALLPALFIGLGRVTSSRLDWAGKLLIFLILALLAVQFLPIAGFLPVGDYFATTGTVMLSPAPSKSLESALFAVSLIGFFLYLARFSDDDQERCLAFLVTGFAVNILVGILQLSFGQRLTTSGVLPFDITAGLFANENHFSSLIYIMIPLLAYQLVAKRRSIFLYLLSATLIVGFLFATGARTGTAIAVALAFLSLLWFVRPGLGRAAKFGLLICWIAAIVAVSWLLGLDAELANDFRAVVFGTTWKAALDHLPFGSGLGTFIFVYPAYELRDEIGYAYANHAHNDILELFLETGFIGTALIGVFLVLALRSFSRSPLAEAAFIAVLALLLHSIVDYPLRTMALGAAFAWLAAVLLVRPAKSVERARKSFRGEEGISTHQARSDLAAGPRLAGADSPSL